MRKKKKEDSTRVRMRSDPVKASSSSRAVGALHDPRRGGGERGQRGELYWVVTRESVSCLLRFGS